MIDCRKMCSQIISWVLSVCSHVRIGPWFAFSLALTFRKETLEDRN